MSVAAGPVLREVPVPALFGVFLYLGVSTLNGVQMFERIKLLFMPVKYHPSVVYVRKVSSLTSRLAYLFYQKKIVLKFCCSF